MVDRRRNIMRMLLILVIIIVAVYIAMQSSLFQIKTVEVSGTRVVSEEEVLMMADVPEDANIFRFNLSVLSKSISLHPLIRSVDIKRKLPGTLRIIITERGVWAVIPYQDSYLFIDEEGVLLDQRLDADLNILPLLTLSGFPDYVVRGHVVNQSAAELAHQLWINLSENEREEISNYHYDVSSGELSLYTIRGMEMRFGDAERMEEKLIELREMIALEKEMLEAGTDAIEYADIRFKGQPVIKFVSD